MTQETIKQRIEEIKRISHDDEVAHSMEDELREDFIRYVENCDNFGTDYPSPIPYMAKLVLSTNEIKFARWCA